MSSAIYPQGRMATLSDYGAVGKEPSPDGRAPHPAVTEVMQQIMRVQDRVDKLNDELRVVLSPVLVMNQVAGPAGPAETNPKAQYQPSSRLFGEMYERLQSLEQGVMRAHDFIRQLEL